jgi:SAM-dependent methyltransferase
VSYSSAHRLQDRAGRLRRAARIARVLEELGGVDLAAARLLDVGASHGLITLALAERTASAVGVDVDREGILAAANESGRASFAIASGMELPFAAESFDAVICNHIYEHVPDAPRMMAEIARVLRPGGTCYFAGGHRLQVIEPHHRLPFLSWLPRPLADAWMRAAGKGQRYEENFLPPWRLPELFSAFSMARNVTPEVLRQCARFDIGPAWLERLFTWILPAWLAGSVAWCLPTHLWLLRK